MSVLAVDVGAGTQDVLLFQESQDAEGSLKMVLPSPTVVVAKRIEQCTQRGVGIYLDGWTMGGGPSVSAVLEHLRSGLPVYATSAAALTINDDLSRVRALGVRVGQMPPDGVERIRMGDLDMISLAWAFRLFGVDLPSDVAVAVQDHGFSPGGSNRIARFRHMARLIRQGGRVTDFSFCRPPEFLSRMAAAGLCLEGQGFSPLLMDTGPAAIFGAMQDERVTQPALALNVGNGHTIAALVDDDRIFGLFEHHTSSLSPSRLADLIERFVKGELTQDEVFGDGGHGVYIEEVSDRLECVVVTGPQRHRLKSGLSGLGDVVMAAPWGDMMIAGCVGLVEAWRCAGCR
ncbi:MAG TPA: DUF1786 domain-containing protein [Methanotrichaceae archaeon]|nr:DUF1786 domain-containing protein [Methanotrichaceae archaeon]HQF16262.1 DUF1786 domain-containing protein [Methanotrichaceae archaeon]HQI90034.1 DUF1786 domain-containing protein [Methanotrichaceae archaeon]HQJ27942.1 DUF1786 domain-containing protein [Methanotrichaceae archaeon]